MVSSDFTEWYGEIYICDSYLSGTNLAQVTTTAKRSTESPGGVIGLFNDVEAEACGAAGCDDDGYGSPGVSVDLWCSNAAYGGQVNCTASTSGGTGVEWDWWWTPDGATSETDLSLCASDTSTCTFTIYEAGTLNVYVGTDNGGGAGGGKRLFVDRPEPANGEGEPDVDDIGVEDGFACDVIADSLGGGPPGGSTIMETLARWNRERFDAQLTLTAVENCAMFQQVCKRPITAAEGTSFLSIAKGQPDWVYSQGATGDPALLSDRSNHVGDCTDFTWFVLKKTFGDRWSHSWSEKYNTKMYHQAATQARNGNASYLNSIDLQLIPLDSIRPGDIIVRGGHAGIFSHKDASGAIWGYANNGTPTVNGDTSTYHNGSTGNFKFTPLYGVAYDVFRPLVPCDAGGTAPIVDRSRVGRSRLRHNVAGRATPNGTINIIESAEGHATS
jgi:hypothetical protein